MKLLNEYLRERFGCKVYKIAVNAGLTCPNRDGKLGTRGCIFCSAGGSGEFAQDSGKPTVTLIVAGRNVIIDEYIDKWDSCIMLYLPGTEGGNAVADVLTQKAALTGTLPMPYYSSVDQIGTDECWHDIGWNALQG